MSNEKDFVIKKGVLEEYKGTRGDVIIPDSVTSIGNYAFADCEALTSIIIPDSVTSIGYYAFHGCESLTDISIPDCVSSFGGRFFDKHTKVSIRETKNSKHTLKKDGCLICDGALIQYVGEEQNAIIPDCVTNIGDGAFSDCESLTSITIPDSVTSIGDRAFSGCESLTSITIPDSVTSIGDSAFSGCESLTSITIPDSVTSIGYYAFYWCESLTDISIPDCVSSFGSRLFDKHTKVSIRETKNSKHTLKKDGCLICDGALIQYVGEEQNAIIPDCVTNIGDHAFADCEALTSITIPDSVTSIGDRAFSDCKSLTSITIPDSVTSIGNYAFHCCKSLTSITIPESVTSIGDWAFSNCQNLTDINLPHSITNINRSAFKRCISLKNISLPNGITHIGDEAFIDCYSLITVNLPNTLTHIGAFAFSECSSVKNIDIPDSVTSIGGMAFAYCKSLKSVTIPAGVTSCGRFGGCNDVENIRLLSTHQEGTERQTSIIRNISGSDIFDAKSKSAIQAVYAPECLISEIENSKMKLALIKGFLEEPEATQNEEAKLAYSDYMYKQKKRVLPLIFAEDRAESLKIYGDAKKITKANYENDFLLPAQEAKAQQCVAFLLDWKNKNISAKDVEKQLEKELTKDPYSATEMKKLWSYELLPDGTAIITNYKGKGTEITIPNRIGSLPVSGLAPELFYPTKKRITKERRNCYNSITSVTILNGIKTIGDRAFKDCESLTSIIIPDSVMRIGEDAFLECGQLASICVSENNPAYYSDSNKALIGKGNRQFIRYAQNSVGDYRIPDSVTSIVDGALRGCKKLTSITIPDNVTSIGNDAFSYCESLTSITIPDSVTSIGNNAFSDCKSLTSITIPDSVTSIGDSAFSDCKSLTSITIPDSVTSIGNNAFSYCKSLTSITIPESVTSIGKYAFLWCYALTSITIPASVKEIATNAFAACQEVTIRGEAGSYAEEYARKNHIPFKSL